MYKVLKHFTDGENGKAWPPDKGGFAYAPGDTYPKEGFDPGEGHIAYLLGKGNRFGAAVIQEVAQDTREAAPAKPQKGGKKKGGARDDSGGIGPAPGATVGPPETPLGSDGD